MSKSVQNSHNTAFSEKNIAANILPLFNLDSADISMVKFKDTDKQRAVYKIDLNNKSYCLKKIYFPEEELLYVYSALEWLHRNNLNVPNLLPSKNKGRYVFCNNMLFILTPWIDGVKCEFDDIKHVLLSIKELAKLHACSKNFKAIEGSSNRVGLDDLHISNDKHLSQLLQYYIYANKYKDSYSKDFLKSFDINIELSNLSTKVSSNIKNKDLSVSLCHGDYVNKNIIIDSSDNIWIIDFDKCKFDYCAHDISYFLRRLLKREGTNWNIDLTFSILKEYNNYNKLTPSDLQYIVAYICFPQKYWKLSRDYYKNRKKCNKQSFIALLQKCTKHSENQLEFAKHIISTFSEIQWDIDKLYNL